MSQEEIIKLLEKEGKVKIMILNKPLSIKELSEKLNASPTSTSHAVNKLLKHNEIKSIELDRFEAQKYLGTQVKRKIRLYYLSD